MGECILTIVPSISHLTRVQEIIAVTNYICKLADRHIFNGEPIFSSETAVRKERII